MILQHFLKKVLGQLLKYYQSLIPNNTNNGISFYFFIHSNINEYYFYRILKLIKD